MLALAIMIKRSWITGLIKAREIGGLLVKYSLMKVLRMR